MKNNLETKVKKFLEKIRKSLERHGGDIRLVKIADQDVYVELQGACKSCPMANLTLKEGIETQMKQEIPEIQNVYDLKLQKLLNHKG